jgi:hypothetical protein
MENFESYNTLLLNDYTSVACAIGPSVNTSSADFPVQNLVFWNLSESKSYQINSIKSCSHRDLSNDIKCTFQFLQNFQLRFNLI